MNQPKSYVYTLILGLCMTICLILIAKMMLHREIEIHMPHMPSQSDTSSPSPPLSLEEYFNDFESNSEILLTNEQITEMINNVLSDYFPITYVNMEIFENNTIKISGNINKTIFKSYIEMLLTGIPLTLDALLFTLPENFETSILFEVSMDLDSGLMLFSPTEVIFDQKTVPSGFLNPKIFEDFGFMINDMLCESELFFSEISLHDGYILLK